MNWRTPISRAIRARDCVPRALASSSCSAESCPPGSKAAACTTTLTSCSAARSEAGSARSPFIQEIESGLTERIAADGAVASTPAGRVSRWVRHFPFEPKITLVRHRRGDRWQLFISCADRPGLLSSISRLFVKHELNLIDARISTLGARAEDSFELEGAALEAEAGRAALVADLSALLAA